VVTPGSPTKKPHYCRIKSIKGLQRCCLHRKKSTGARNAALEKEGKLFVQDLYPNNVFTAGVSFTTLYIKVVKYKGGKVVPVWYCNNNFCTAAFKEVLKSTTCVNLGSERLNYAIFFLVETKTRDTCFGADF
jgi:hypothetical protein